MILRHFSPLLPAKSSPARWLLVAAVAGSAMLVMPGALAQEAGEAAAPVMEEGGANIGKGIKDSIWWLMPLFGCSLALVAIAIYNSIQLTKKKFCPEDLHATLLDHMSACRVRSAIEVAAQSPTYLGRLCATSLPRVDATDPETLGKDAVEDAMAEFTIQENRPYLNWIGYFSILSQVAPMLGLLGTVGGMIGAFAQLTQSGGASPEQLAGDISIALYTTAAGLIVAIPAAFCYFFFRNRFNKLVAETHNAEREMLAAAVLSVNADQIMAKVPEGLAG